MRKVFTIAAATLLAGTAHAADISGEVELNFAENATGDWGGALAIDLGVDAAGLGTVDLDFAATDGEALKLDNWTVGTTVAGVGVHIGDDNGVMPDAEGNHTLAAPAMTESAKLSIGDAHVAVGFGDWKNDLSDISNIQGAYTMGVAGLDVTAAGDYNLDTENTVLGAGVGGLNLGVANIGGALTYDVDAEHFAFEGVATVASVTAYANGDQDDALQNIGGEYVHNFGGAELTAGANYNLDTEDFAPTVSVGFKF